MGIKRKLQSIVDECELLQKDLREIELNSDVDQTRYQEYHEKEVKLKRLLDKADRLIEFSEQ